MFPHLSECSGGVNMWFDGIMWIFKMRGGGLKPPQIFVHVRVFIFLTLSCGTYILWINKGYDMS